MERTASCSCGQLQAVCAGEPVRVSMCHCHACQRRTGSVFGVQARFERERVRVTGVASEWSRTGDAGGRGTFRFCATCGAIVYWELDAVPGFVTLPVGAFADATFPPPTIAVYDERRHPWVVAPCESFE